MSFFRRRQRLRPAIDRSMDLLTPPKLATQSDLYAVFANKDMRYDGHLFLGVTSTGIFCRPGCPAKLPKFENCQYYDTANEALAAGFRACKRCHPSGGETALIRKLITLVESENDLKITHATLEARGIDGSTARRQFLSRFGMSFIDYARARRLARGASGFRSAYSKTFGEAPSKTSTPPLFIDWLETPMGRMIAIADEAALYG